MTRNFQPAEDKSKQAPMWGQAPQLPTEWDCVIYPRISTPGQRGNVSSELQLKEDGELWNLALRCDWKQHQVRHPIEDMELSGTLRMEDRPAFKQMLQWIIKGEVRAVIAVNVDRLFRDKWGTEYSKFMEICEKYHVIVVTPDMVYNFSDGYCIKLFRDRCIQAWEYLEYQVYKRMLGAKDYLGETGRWAGGNLPPGYIVDRNKKSETFRRYIKYMPWSPIILRMFERYRELNDNLMALHREYDEKPFMFPNFEEWVDPEIIAKCKLKKVPDGYTMSLSAMTRMLTNPVYLGWWIYENKILVGEDGKPIINHEAIIPVARQDELFWHVFKQRSPYNIDGTKNEDTIGQRPRRYTQLNSPPNPALLKLIVSSGDPDFTVRVQPQYNAKSMRTGKYLYTFRKRMNGYSGSAKYMLATDMVDSVYWQRLIERLRETNDFTSFATTEEKTDSNREAEIKEATALIDAVERKLTKLLKRLALVKEGEEDEEDNIITLTEEEQKAREAAVKKMLKFLTDEITKFTIEKQRLETRLAKLEGGKPDTYYAQMIEYHELLQEVGDRARKIYTVEELHDVIDTFTTGVILDTISPRVWKMIITWRDPEWGCDEIVCMRTEGNPSITWTEEELTILHEYYETATRRKLLTMLPNRSWIAIRTIASEKNLRRKKDISNIMFPYDMCLLDWNAIQEYMLPVFIGNNGITAYREEESGYRCNSMGIGKLTRSWR